MFSGAHSTIQIELQQEKSRYLEWQTVTGVKIARAWLWDITLFCSPQSRIDSSFWGHRRGQGRQEVGWGSSTILTASSMKAEGAALLSTNLSLLLSPSYFLQKSKNQICLHFWETRSLFLMPSDWSIVCPTLFLIFCTPPTPFHSNCLGFVMIWITFPLTVIRLKY